MTKAGLVGLDLSCGIGPAGVGFCDKFLQPAEHSLPAIAVGFGLVEIASKTFLRNAHQRASSRLPRAAGVQSVHGLGLKFPADDSFLLAGVTADPSVDQLARRIYFEIFAFHVEFGAIGASSIATPFTAGAHIHSGFSNAVQTLLSPPARELGWIADCLKNARRWRGDEDLSGNGVLIRRNCGCGHALSA